VSEEVGPLGPVGAEGWQEADVSVSDGTNLAFEVQYLLEADDSAVTPLRAALGELGDSLVVVGGGGLYNVHVHTNEPDRAVEAGEDAGRPRNVSVVSLRDQATSCIGGQAREVRLAEQPCGLVAVAEGDGLARTFRSLGALVVEGGPGNNPAVSAVLAAIELAPAPAVVVLPNHPNVIQAAERAAGQTRKDVRVVPTRSIPAGLGAATAFNPVAEVDENAKEMEGAAGSCRSGEVARAERDAETIAGPVRAGEWMGLADGEVAWVGHEPVRAVMETTRRLIERDGVKSELITLIWGAAALESDRRAAEAELREAFPELEVEVIEGGQPRYPYLIGVE
jgi:dihydroxyacetone kinase-like predicted kinase